MVFAVLAHPGRLTLTITLAKEKIMCPGTTTKKQMGLRRSFANDPANQATRKHRGGRKRSYPVNLSESPNEYILVFDTPGFRRFDLNIEIDNGVLHISAARQSALVEQQGDKTPTPWISDYELPEDADAILTHAEWKNGELILRIPKGNTFRPAEKTPVYIY